MLKKLRNKTKDPNRAWYCFDNGLTKCKHKITMSDIDNELVQSLGEQLIHRQQSVAVAESVTGGLLQYALSGVVNAAKFYEGGLTVYNISHKCRLLGVEPHHAMAVNCVSGDVAGTMALNVAKLFDSDWGIAITGYATPVPESNQKLYAFYCISFRNKVIKEGKIVPAEKDPEVIQAVYVNEVFKNLATLVQAQKLY
jgi:nicotinamide-nucleotide amidase